MDAPPNRTSMLFGCPETRVDYFWAEDELNEACKLEGQVCHYEGTHFGSLSITTVGEEGYGIPRFLLPFEEGKYKTDVVDLTDAIFCYLLPFPAGLLLQIYKYFKEGEICCTIKSRGLPTVSNSFFYPFRSLLFDLLKWPKQGFSEWALATWPALQDPINQSITFLLHGSDLSRFFIYQSSPPSPKTPLTLTPLFTTMCDGQILVGQEGGLQIKSEELLVAAAAVQSAKNGGGLLFVINATRQTCSYRTVYRIPPANWWPESVNLNEVVMRAIDGVRASAKPWLLEAVREEAGIFGPSAVWKHYSKYFAELLKTTLSTARNAPPAIVLIGVPGSGKSTFSHSMIKGSCLWRHVSQDLLGTKKVVRAVMEEAIQAGFGVILDKCNVEVNHRKGWLTDLKKCGVHHIIAVWLDTDTALCKTRVMTRADHPTLPAVERSKAVVDEFADSFEKPSAKEGFADIMRLKTEKEVRTALEELCRWDATRDLTKAT